MIERIIEIAETAAYLSLENELLKIRLPDGKSTTVPVSEIQCLLLSNPALSVSGALLSAQTLQAPTHPAKFQAGNKI